MSKLNSRWEIEIHYEMTNDLSGRTPFDLLNVEKFSNQTFGQAFEYVRGFFKTRGLNSEYNPECQFNNMNVGDALFNPTNDPDFPYHIDEARFVTMFDEIYAEHLSEYSRWLGDEFTDPYYATRNRLIESGLMLVTVYKNQSGLGRILSETVYLKKIS